MNATRDFHADLAMSNQPDVATSIKAACHASFPEVLSINQAHKDNDKLGADYWLEFPCCKMEALDVKVRKQDYTLRGDDRTACLEIVSNIRTGKLGWTLDPSKRTDWIMFFYIETGRYVFYHARSLRAAVIRFLPDLRKKGKSATQTTISGSGYYESESLFVSHRELGAAIYLNSQRSIIRNGDKAVAA